MGIKNSHFLLAFYKKEHYVMKHEKEIFSLGGRLRIYFFY